MVGVFVSQTGCCRKTSELERFSFQLGVVIAFLSPGGAEVESHGWSGASRAIHGSCCIAR